MHWKVHGYDREGENDDLGGRRWKTGGIPSDVKAGLPQK